MIVFLSILKFKHMFWCPKEMIYLSTHNIGFCRDVRNLILEVFYIFTRIQEIMGDDQKEAGRIPRTIDCELTQDLGSLPIYISTPLLLEEYLHQ